MGRASRLKKLRRGPDFGIPHDGPRRPREVPEPKPKIGLQGWSRSFRRSPNKYDPPPVTRKPRHKEKTK